MPRCGDCRFREGGACLFSEDPENPARPNFDEDCIFDPPKFERKPDPYARVISPLEEPNPAPRNPELQSRPPAPGGYSLVCRQSPDKLGSIRFYVKDGKCYSPDEEKRYLGTLDEMTPKDPTPAELDEAWKQLKTRFNL
jgi:hypothetical protein